MNAAQFEEKEYETPLYSQLVGGGKNLWTPGQVLEHYLGFDAALSLDDPYLWHLHGFRNALRGFSPSRFRWPLLPRNRGLRSRLPRFRINCFIQAKRPQFGSRVPVKLVSLGPDRPFFKFSIDTDQQNTLEAAAKRFQGRALFSYAAPVFYQSRDLFRHTTAGSIVENSTFPDIGSLAGQHAWYYNRPGAVGIANRSFEYRQMPSLEDRIKGLIGEHESQTEENQSPSAALAELFSELHDLITESSNLGDQPRAAYLTTEWRRISALEHEIDAPPALFSYLRIEAFATYFNLIWLTIA